MALRLASDPHVAPTRTRTTESSACGLSAAAPVSYGRHRLLHPADAVGGRPCPRVLWGFAASGARQRPPTPSSWRCMVPALNRRWRSSTLVAGRPAGRRRLLPVDPPAAHSHPEPDGGGCHPSGQGQRADRDSAGADSSWVGCTLGMRASAANLAALATQSLYRLLPGAYYWGQTIAMPASAHELADVDPCFSWVCADSPRVFVMEGEA